MQHIIIENIEGIPDAARQLMEAVGDSSILAFYGEMGAGKTTLIREICSQTGVTDAVNSPTFSIVNEYETGEGRRIYHFDFYRINRTEEALDFGCEEYFDSGCLCLLEWPERVEAILPPDVCKITISVEAGGVRRLSISQIPLL